jgi:hypothetical protein
MTGSMHCLMLCFFVDSIELGELAPAVTRYQNKKYEILRYVKLRIISYIACKILFQAKI